MSEGGPEDPLTDNGSASLANVGNRGAARYSVPIVVPPGTNGVQPKLALTYNSHSQENGLLGIHWQLSGLPTIERCPRTIAQDNFKGGVNYDGNDRFCLDGARLILVSGTTYGADNTEYRTEIDSFVKIKAFGTAGNGPSYFKLSTKAGAVMEFGNSADSKIEAAGIPTVRVWALNKMQDVNGNYFTVTYTEDNANGDYRPSRIDYTGNSGLTPNRSVQFFYEDRTDIAPKYVNGSVIKIVKRLINAKTYFGATLVKNYKLTYGYGTATNRSRLTSIQQCSNDACTSQLPANTFVWQEGGDGTYTRLTGSYNLNWDASKSWVGDFNGDGKADLLAAYGGYFHTFFSNGDGTYTMATTTYDVVWDANKAYVGDFNGDGKADLLGIYGTYNSGTFYTWFSNGDGTYTRQTSTWNTPWNIDYPKIGDFNGDGKTDVLGAWGAPSGYFITFFANGNGAFTSATYSYNFTWDAGKAWVGDFNGDGKADLLAAYGTYNSGTFYTWLSNGDGSYIQRTSSWNISWNFDYPKIGDFNGDGRTDVLGAWGVPSGYFVTFFAKSDGTFTTATNSYNVNWDASKAWVGDFNGDGKADILAAYGSYYSGTFYTWSSNGDGSYVQRTGSWSDAWNFDYPKIGDFTGDGKTDVVGAWGVPAGNFLTFSPNGAYPDLVTTINNGFGGGNTITYKPISDNTIYAKDTGSACPPGENPCYSTMHFQQPLYVVSNMTVADGLGASYPSSYTYGGAKFHHWGRGWLGFRWLESNDLTAKVRTKEFLNQTFPFTGTASESEIYDATNQSSPLIFAETWHTYINPAPNPYPGVYFVAPSRVDALQYDGQGTPRQSARTMEYDNTYGNPTRTFNLGDVSFTGDERDERTDWIVDVANWLHRPKRTALYDGAGVLVREKWLYYDNQAYGVLGPKGLVTKEEANAGGGIGHANNPIGTHVYDPVFGIKTSVTDARGCATTTTYEATKTFPATVTNCLNHQSTMVYDARFGVMTSQTDANNQTTTSEYDAFGRLTKTTGPLDGGSTYGTVTRQYLDWGNPALQRVKTLRTEQHGTANHIWSEQYFDGLGRNDQAKQEGPAGQVITTDRTHDSRSLPTAQSAPFFNGETPKYATTQYDVLGRPTRFTHPDGRFAIAAYAPGKVTLTDERGKVKRKFFDAHGQLTKVEEVNGSETYVTTYGYDTAGSLTTVINHLTHTTRMAYDMLGRKIAMCDPNMGTASGVTSCTINSVGAWVYTYNPASDLLTQKDAKNQTLTFTYDILGRPLTKKQGTTSLVTWTYDDPTVLYSKGRVTQVVDQATTTKFAYDQLGRPTQSQRLQLGVWHTMAQQYDALSRITSETFPDNETISYTYNEAGWLSSVPGYINGLTYNARGQKTALTYANNLTTTWTFDANNFRVTNRTTSSNQQNLTYGYDNNGNITSITDSLFTASRTFTYDDLNRMISGSGTFGTNQAQTNCSYTYNSIGNLTNKCGAALTYGDSLHPSAVTFNPATNKSYTYDANGNMLTRGNQTLTWDIDNRVTSVTIGASSTIMEYDYTGTRVKKNAPGGTTLFPFAGYEVDPSGTITKYVRIAGESFAAKKGTAKYFYHNDHLRSVNVITDINGTRVQLNEYDPWGSVSRAEGNIDPTHRFTGEELDPETGLYYYGGRYYDHEISRFISPDPFIQEPDDPQNLNRYSYVMNNPQIYIDPSGFEYEYITTIESQTFDQLFRNARADYADGITPYSSLSYCCATEPYSYSSSRSSGSDIFSPYNPLFDTSYSAQTAAFNERNARIDALNAQLPGPSVAQPVDIWGSAAATARTVLDIAGFVPGINTVANLANAAISFAQGDFVGGGINILAAAPLVGPVVKGGAAVVRIGQAGEKAVRLVHNIGEKAKFVVNNRNRIADGLNPWLHTISEVKNRASQGLTRQVQDYIDFSQQVGLRFDLYVKRGAHLSERLEEAIESGLIRLRFIP